MTYSHFSYCVLAVPGGVSELVAGIYLSRVLRISKDQLNQAFQMSLVFTNQTAHLEMCQDPGWK